MTVDPVLIYAGIKYYFNAKGNNMGHYSKKFADFLSCLGPISIQKFCDSYGCQSEYLTQISYDVTQAKFWNEFNIDIKEYNRQGQAYPPRFDEFTLTPEEQEIFKKNGFVVTERLGSNNFAKAFFKIYRNDLPVFISVDAILHAWHRSYDAILEEIEAFHLCSSVYKIIKGLKQQLELGLDNYPKNSLSLRVAYELDYFLEVARLLFSGVIIDPPNIVQDNPAFFHRLNNSKLFTSPNCNRYIKDKKHFNKAKVYSLFQQEDRIGETLENIAAAESIKTVTFLDQKYQIDFSLFYPRGHYVNSPEITRYFRGMIWLSTLDFRRIDEKEGLQSLGAVLELYNLLKKAEVWETWQALEQFLTGFLGESDYMNFLQLEQLLNSVKIQVPVDINNAALLKKIQQELAKSPWGHQEICGHYYESPEDDSQSFKLPRSFTVIGQRFTLDSWVFSKIVYDQIWWRNKKVPRLIPSALDFAFTTLGNCQVIPEIVARITNKQGQKFRDGLPYHHHLAALKEVIDLLSPGVESKTIYTAWLATLRSLSEPTTDPRYPEVMRTRAWAMKTVNTQLASWTQLRHDNILYVKQSDGLSGVCEYPDGFVEPRPEFWDKFEQLVKLAATVIETSSIIPDVVHKQRLVKFLENFAQTLIVLKDLAHKELQNIPFNSAEIKFIRDLIEAEEQYGHSLQGTGWYPGLFYKGMEDADKAEPLICDVHTAPPNKKFNYPGSILYQAVGNVDFMLIAVENGPDKMIYAGPVLSHYEFEEPFGCRLADSEWEDRLRRGNAPPNPEWTTSYRPKPPVIEIEEVEKLYFDFDEGSLRLSRDI